MRSASAELRLTCGTDSRMLRKSCVAESQVSAYATAVLEDGRLQQEIESV
jgi:hypothetical protein